METRRTSHKRVFIWFAGRWRNHQPKRAEKPHSKSCDRKAQDGPAMRPETPLAVENGVGKPAAPEAPNVGTGKRAFEPGRTRGQGKARENLSGRRRCYKRHRWPVSEKQPESSEARPVALGQRTVKSSGRPSAKWSRRAKEVIDVSWSGSQAGGAITSPSELKSLTR